MPKNNYVRSHLLLRRTLQGALLFGTGLGGSCAASSFINIGVLSRNISMRLAVFTVLSFFGSVFGSAVGFSEGLVEIEARNTFKFFKTLRKLPAATMPNEDQEILNDLLSGPIY